MRDYYLVKISNINPNLFLEYILKEKIDLLEIKYFQNYFYVKCNPNDYLKLKKSRKFKTKKIRSYGLIYLKKMIKKNYIYIINFIIGYFLLMLISNVILEVKVLHNNDDLRSLVTKELYDYGIKKYSFKKNYEQITKIKNDILDNYKDQIEWLEIENVGMKYIIHLEERIINPDVPKDEKCHIVAKRDAMILDIMSKKGQRNVYLYDYVKAGDILISGDIIYNNEIKSSVCADGYVWGEVWYKVNVSVPLKYYETKYTGNKRYNVRYKTSLKDDVIFRSKFKNYEVKSKRLFNILGFELYFNTEYENKLIPQKYSEEEALKVALEQVDEKMKTKMQYGDEILSKKVLKKELINSTMNVEVFVVVKENIGTTQKYQ